MTARPIASPHADAVSLDAAIDALMLQLAAGDRFERLGAIAQEHLLTGGKKLRARLALSAASALGVDPSLHLGWAAACELLHNASLIHDDVQDQDRYRRGSYSVWVRHGEAQAINAGDLLLMLPYVALEHIPVDGALRWELTRAIARRAEETVRGQSLEMCLLSSSRWNWESYDEAVCGKTSALFALPVQGAALLAGRDAEEAERLSDAFSPLGLLFQLQDDVIDLYGDKGRAHRGADLREGKISALVVEHLTQHPQDLEWLGPLLGKPKDETSDEDVQRTARRFENAGTLGGVLARIEEVDRSIGRCEALASEPALQGVARKLADRALRSIRPLMEARR